MTLRLKYDRHTKKIYLTRISKKTQKKTPLMTIPFNPKKEFGDGFYISLYAFSGEKMGMRFYIDEVNIQENTLEVATNIEKDQ